jgi:hypothetical protein
MDDDSKVAFELFLLTSNMRKEMCVMDSFISFYKKYEKKAHNMFSLMVNARFKSLYLVSSFISHA